MAAPKISKLVPFVLNHLDLITDVQAATFLELCDLPPGADIRKLIESQDFGDMTVADIFGRRNVKARTRKNNRAPTAIMVGGRHWMQNTIAVAQLVIFLAVVIAQIYPLADDYPLMFSTYPDWQRYILVTIVTAFIARYGTRVGVRSMLETIMGIENMNVIKFTRAPGGQWQLQPIRSQLIRRPLYEQEVIDEDVIPLQGAWVEAAPRPEYPYILLGHAPLEVVGFFRTNGSKRVIRALGNDTIMDALQGPFMQQNNTIVTVNAANYNNGVKNIISYENLRNGNLIVNWPGRAASELLTPGSYAGLPAPKMGPLTRAAIANPVIRPIRIRRGGSRKRRASGRR